MSRVVVARLDEFPPDERRIVTAGGRSIGVFRVGDRFFAIRNRCPHQGGPLSQGRVFPRASASAPGEYALDEDVPLLACPWHGWEYDLATGQSWIGAAEPHVRSYPVSVERGDVLAAALEVPGEATPGPYVAETFPVSVEEQYVVLDA
ncbi:MAG: Rieske 2Fe-2S domain-containing protein [bacterium]|nr:Rieske 2Fe-2S domain-containing protein [bacterium]